MPWRGGWRLEHKKKDKSRLWQSVVTRVEINSTKKKGGGGKGINSINRGLKISTTSTNIRHLPKKIVQLSFGLKESTLCTYTPHIKLFPTRRYATRGKKKAICCSAQTKSHAALAMWYAVTHNRGKGLTANIWETLCKQCSHNASLKHATPLPNQSLDSRETRTAYHVFHVCYPELEICLYVQNCQGKQK